MLIPPPGPIDIEIRGAGYRLLAGVDESGRGPLAGPVVAAAVILPPDNGLPAVLDSKGIPAARREELYDRIVTSAVSWSVARVDHDIIDETDILKATLTAMSEAVRGLETPPDFILVDGIHAPPLPATHRTLRKGDEASQCIGAASILAKVTRDRIMGGYHERWPEYGFHRHKGYGTREHLQAIARHGPCPIHRLTFAGVREHVGREKG